MTPTVEMTDLAVSMHCHTIPQLEIYQVSPLTMILRIVEPGHCDHLVKTHCDHLVKEWLVSVTMTFTKPEDKERFLETIAEVGNNAYVQHLVMTTKGGSSNGGEI